MTLRVLGVFGPLLPEEFSVWRSVRDAGVDVHIVGTDSWFWPGYSANPPQRPQDLNAHTLRPQGLVSRGPLWWRYRGLRPLIRKLQPSVVHVHSEPWGALVQQALLESRTRVVAHGADNVYALGSNAERFIRRAILRATLPRLAGFASWNENGVTLARQYGLKPDTPTVVVPGVVPDPEDFLSPAIRETGSLRVGFIGRIIPEKGLGHLIDALASRSELRESVVLRVAGTGPDLEACRERAESAAIAVEFVNELSRGKVPDFLRSVDLVVVPTLVAPDYREQFGRVVVEARFARRAVIVSDSGELPVVAGPDAVVFPAGNVSALASALLDSARSRATLRNRAEAGYGDAIARYSPSVLAERLISFWSHL